jgi:hypothetical protein
VVALGAVGADDVQPDTSASAHQTHRVTAIEVSYRSAQGDPPSGAAPEDEACPR